MVRDEAVLEEDQKSYASIQMVCKKYVIRWETLERGGTSTFLATLDRSTQFLPIPWSKEVPEFSECGLSRIYKGGRKLTDLVSGAHWSIQCIIVTASATEFYMIIL